MLPNISLRLKNIIKSMEYTIKPAIDASDALAVEQAALVISQLQVIDEQWDKALRFEKGTLEGLYWLGSELIKLNIDFSEDYISKRLESCLNQNMNHAYDSINEVNKQIRDVGFLIDEYIAVNYKMAKADDKERIKQLVLSQAIHQTTRERVWFKSTGLDPDAEKLGTIDDMLKLKLSD